MNITYKYIYNKSHIRNHHSNDKQHTLRYCAGVPRRNDTPTRWCVIMKKRELNLLWSDPLVCRCVGVFAELVSAEPTHALTDAHARLRPACGGPEQLTSAAHAPQPAVAAHPSRPCPHAYHAAHHDHAAALSLPSQVDSLERRPRRPQELPLRLQRRVRWSWRAAARPRRDAEQQIARRARSAFQPIWTRA